MLASGILGKPDFEMWLTMAMSTQLCRYTCPISNTNEPYEEMSQELRIQPSAALVVPICGHGYACVRCWCCVCIACITDICHGVIIRWAAQLHGNPLPASAASASGKQCMISRWALCSIILIVAAILRRAIWSSLSSRASAWQANWQLHS